MIFTSIDLSGLKYDYNLRLFYGSHKEYWSHRHINCWSIEMEPIYKLYVIIVYDMILILVNSNENIFGIFFYELCELSMASENFLILGQASFTCKSAMKFVGVIFLKDQC